jgi:predicted dehydrogenase
MRAAIVGAGGIGRIHAHAIRMLGGEIVGVCGSSLASARAFGYGPAYADYERMLKETRPEVVHICTPNHLHKAQALAAFAAGANVLCEKPLATSIADAEIMIEAAARAKRIGAVMYHNRGYPLVQLMRERVARGDLGRVFRVGGCYQNDEGLSPERFTWHFVSDQVGRSFAMMDIGVHWMDLAECVTGQRICEISALFTTHHPRRIWTGQPGQGPRPAGRQTPEGVEIDVVVEEHAELLVRFDEGAAGSATICTMSAGYPNRLELSLDGQTLGLDWVQQEPDWYLERSRQGLMKRFRNPADLSPASAAMSFLPPGCAEGHGEAFRHVIQQCWLAMSGREAAYPSFKDGLRGLCLVDAAIRSNAARSAVTI